MRSDFELAAATPRDYPFLYELLVTGDGGRTWRFRSSTPSPDTFEQALWAGVLCHFVLHRRQHPVGYVACFNPMHESGHAEIGIVIAPSAQQSGALAAGALGLLEYVFSGWPFRKIYARVPGFNRRRLESMADHGWAEEGVLSEHTYAFGQYWDEHVMAIRRQRHVDVFEPNADFAAKVVSR